MHWLAVLIWTAYVVVVFILIRRRLAARRTLAPVKLADLSNPPSVSFIIPARNEAENIIACLESLLAQEYPVLQVEFIVVDDNSSDNTAELVRRLQSKAPAIKLISAPPLPEDWYGKPHACWVGASHAKGEWLCFIDADVRLHPDLLASAMGDVLEHKAQLLSLHPHQEMLTFGERFLMPPAFMGLLILMDFDRINNPESRLAMANGQFIMVRRDRYFDFDGHRSVQSELLEDVALARRAKRSEARIRLLAGGALIRTRMYSSASTIWQGLTRGVVEVAGGPLFASATIGSTLVLGWLPVLLPIGLLFSAALPVDAKVILLSLTAITTALWYGALGQILRWYGVPRRYLLLLPFSFSALSLAITDGLLRYFTRRRVWKDRHL
jgi:hypothetical protein